MMSEPAPDLGTQELRDLEHELNTLTESPPANLAAALESLMERSMALPPNVDAGCARSIGNTKESEYVRSREQLSALLQAKAD